MSGQRRRVRLLRVMVQPEFVIDDGETLTPVPPQGAEVPASAWAEFAADGFAEAVNAIQQQLDGTD